MNLDRLFTLILMTTTTITTTTLTTAMADPLSPRYQGIPDILYGTAFKFERSASLVEAALNAGFRAVDTAGSQSAYREALVGKGICERSELYVRTSRF